MNTIKTIQPAQGEIVRPPNKIKRFFMNVLMPLMALTCGVAITYYLLNTSPKVRPSKRPPSAILVEVQELKSGAQQTLISAMGEIIPARAIEIKPQVSGVITNISDEFQLGAYFQQGEELVSIDRTDYELLLQQVESDVAKAESDLELEMGNQRIAEREFAILAEKVNSQEKSLMLRKPQLEKLQAVRDYASSRLSQARLNLERTTIKAPFNGVIEEKLVDKGTKVTETTILARIVGTDSFWLQLTLPIENLQWLKIPDSSKERGSRVTIYPQGGNSKENSRQGEIVRLIASLEEQGRMAQLLVKIDDPLCKKAENTGKPKLLLGSYVRAEIEGIAIESGYGINRKYLHDGNTVWLMDENGRLDIREVTVSFRGRDQVIINNGLKDGENLVVSTLPSPVAGIPLRLAEDQSKNPAQPGMGRENGDRSGAKREGGGMRKEGMNRNPEGRKGRVE